MSSNNKQFVRQRMSTVTRKRLYKAKNHWNVATVGMVAAFGGVVGAAGTVHADTTTANNDAAAAIYQDPGITNPDGGTVTATAGTTNTSATALLNQENGTVAPTSVISANSQVNTTVAQNTGAIVSAGGTVTSTSAQPVGPGQEDSLANDASRQQTAISAAGSADNVIMSGIRQGSSVTSAFGGYMKPTSAVDVTSMGSQQINAIAHSIASLAIAVGSNNAAESNAAKGNGGAISGAGGIMKPGKPVNVTKLSPEEIEEITSTAIQILSATGSADSLLTSASNQYTSAINAAGGQLKRSQAINTADNWTAHRIDRNVHSQIDTISATTSADNLIRSFVSSALTPVNNNGGKMTAGSAIDVTEYDPLTIESLVDEQSMMVSATASADVEESNARSRNNSAINGAGGSITAGSRVNTADNMTVAEIRHLVDSNVANIDATGSVDAEIISNTILASQAAAKWGVSLGQGSNFDVSKMDPEQIKALGEQLVTILKDVTDHNNSLVNQVSQVGSYVSAAWGVMDPGSAINITNWTHSQVVSEMIQQSEMISVTGSADSDVKSHADSAAPDITKIKGTIKQSGTINTADNMNVSDVDVTVKSQDARISQTASADRIIASEMAKNSAWISEVSGTMAAGSAFDTTNMDPALIAQLVSHQSLMLSATGSADADILSNVKSATPDITKDMGGSHGEIINDGPYNTADNWTVSDIDSTLHSQDEKISAIASADRVIYDAWSKNHGYIETISGVATPGSTYDVSGLTLSEIASLTEHYRQMVNATGSADSVLNSIVTSVTPTLTKDGGFIKADPEHWNTADGWTTSQIASDLAIQSQKISVVSTTDSQLSELGSIAKSYLSFGGGLKVSGTMDVSSMTLSQIESVAHSQLMYGSQVNSNNSAMSSALNTVKSEVEAVGGHLVAGSTVDVSTMTMGQLQSLVASQLDKLQATGNADAELAKLLASSAAITGEKGVLTKGSDIDASSMTASQIRSLADAQNKNLLATISADTALASARNHVASTTVTIGAPTDVSSMTSDQIKSLAKSEIDAMGETQTANEQVSRALSDALPHMKAVGGKTIPVASTNTTNLTSAELAAIVSSQTEKLAQTATADDMISEAISKYSLVVMSSVSAINTTSMTSSALLSEVKSQVAHISHTSSMDSTVRSDVAASSAMINEAGGTITVSGINNTTTSSEDVMTSWTVSETGHISHVGSQDRALTSASNSAKPSLALLGGKAVSKAAVDVTSWTNFQIDSFMMSQIDIISLAASADSRFKSQYDYASAAPVAMNPTQQINVSTAAEIGSVVSLMNSETHSAVTVAQASNAFAGSVALSNAAMSSAISNLVKAGGKVGPTSTIDLNIGNDWHSVWNNVAIQGARLSAAAAPAISSAVQATDTLNYIHSTLDSEVASLKALVRQTSNARLVEGQPLDVRSASSASADFAKQSSTVSMVISQIVDEAAEMASAGALNQRVSNNVIDSLYGSASNMMGVNPNVVTSHSTVNLTPFPVEDNPYNLFGDSSEKSLYWSYETSYNEYYNYVKRLRSQEVDSAVSAANAEYQAEVQSVAAALQARSQYNEQYAQQVEQLKNQIGTGQENYGNWTNFGMRDVGPGVSGKGTGQYNPANRDSPLRMMIVPDDPHKIPIPDSQIIYQIQWGNVSPERLAGNMRNGINRNWYRNWDDYTQAYTISDGAVLKFPGIVQMKDGSHHDLIAQFGVDNDGTLNDTEISVWNNRGAINYINHAVRSTHNHNGVHVKYWIDSSNNQTNYLWSNLEADIDCQQLLTSPDATVMGIGTGVSVQSSRPARIKSTQLQDLHGFDSSPVGTVLYSAWSPTFDKDLNNDGSVNALGVADADFGVHADIEGVPYRSLNLQLHKIVLEPTLQKPQVRNVPVYGYVDNAVISPVVGHDNTPEPHMTAQSVDPVYQAESTTYNKVRTNYHADDTNLIPNFNYKESPLSTTYHVVNNNGGFSPEALNYKALGINYHVYDTNGKVVPPAGGKTPGTPDTPNTGFTGYAPLSVHWKGYETDGRKIPPFTPGIPGTPPSVNIGFTGFTPWSTTWKNYSSDGKNIPPVIPDPKNPGHYIKNPKFTGYTPMTTDKRALATKYLIFDSDGKNIPPVIPDPKNPGHYIPNPKFTGYAPLSNTYRPFDDDGTKVPSIIPDPHNPGECIPNPKFTGYAPQGMTYSPFKVTYHNYKSNGGNDHVTPPNPPTPNIPPVTPPVVDEGNIIIHYVVSIKNPDGTTTYHTIAQDRRLFTTDQDIGTSYGITQGDNNWPNVISHYQFDFVDGHSAPLNGQVIHGDQEITLVYKDTNTPVPKPTPTPEEDHGNVIVHYVVQVTNPDGSVTYKTISTDQKLFNQDQKVGHSYGIKPGDPHWPNEIGNYTFDHVDSKSDPLTGQIIKGDREITLVYVENPVAQKGNVIVKYVQEVRHSDGTVTYEPLAPDQKLFNVDQVLHTPYEVVQGMKIWPVTINGKQFAYVLKGSAPLKGETVNGNLVITLVYVGPKTPEPTPNPNPVEQKGNVVIKYVQEIQNPDGSVSYQPIAPDQKYFNVDQVLHTPYEVVEGTKMWPVTINGMQFAYVLQSSAPLKGETVNGDLIITLVYVGPKKPSTPTPTPSTPATPTPQPQTPAPQPQVPTTPQTPQGPNTPAVPSQPNNGQPQVPLVPQNVLAGPAPQLVSPQTPSPALSPAPQAVMSSAPAQPGPASPAQPLPQTGRSSVNGAIALLGFAMLASTTALAFAKRDRREED